MAADVGMMWARVGIRTAWSAQEKPADQAEADRRACVGRVGLEPTIVGL